MNIEKMIAEGQGTIVDVRSPMEFIGGNAPDTINIPLDEVPSRLGEFRTMAQPLILCCASGNRSGQATRFLSSHGIACYNAGSWIDVNYVKSQALQS